MLRIEKQDHTTWRQKGLKKATHYKYQVVAYKITNGKKVTLAKSTMLCMQLPPVVSTQMPRK